MKNYFTPCRLGGLGSMAVFVLCIAFGSSLDFSHGFLFVLLGLTVSVASFYAVNRILPPKEDRDWLALVPFALLAVLTSLFLGWDITLPFLICGLLAVGVSAASRRIARLREKKPDSTVTFQEFLPVLLILGAVFLSSVLFICICAFVRVFA